MSKQTTSNILMIRPAAFGYNVETAANNTFQHRPAEGEQVLRQHAIDEFDQMVGLLKGEGINVMVIQDSPEPVKPDAIFPNNWISFHEDGTVVTYPMFSGLRRLERRPEILEEIAERYSIYQRIALEGNEKRSKYLEGTGSMVLDRQNKIAYACLSPRTDEVLLRKWCACFDYRPFVFHARYQGQDIYHTNVMMAIGDGVAVAGLEVVEENERDEFLRLLASSGRDVIALRSGQIGSFAGNMMALRNRSGDQIMVMSARARQSLDDDQVRRIQQHARILSVDVHHIETAGGGSVRCMIAENFLSQI